MSSETKVQVLLRSGVSAADSSRARRWFEDHGLEVTGAGARTLSLRGAPDQVARTFALGAAPREGFAPSLEAAETLDVPAELRDVVELITLVAKHVHH